MRILGARMGASTEPDEAAAADLIRRDLEGEGRPDLPLAFSELHHALTARLPNPATRWALLQALHLIARDRKKARIILVDLLKALTLEGGYVACRTSGKISNANTCTTHPAR